MGETCDRGFLSLVLSCNIHIMTFKNQSSFFNFINIKALLLSYGENCRVSKILINL